MHRTGIVNSVRFYPSSIDQVVKASQKKQPFILKLYGDLDEIDSIKFGHRQLTGLYSEDVREQLPDTFISVGARSTPHREAFTQARQKTRVVALVRPTCQSLETIRYIVYT